MPYADIELFRNQLIPPVTHVKVRLFIILAFRGASDSSKLDGVKELLDVAHG